MANKNILFIEPGYKNKYPPLGLMKIASYHGKYGKKDNLTFIKGEDRKVLSRAWDRIYVTSLFSFEWKNISKSIDFALEVAQGQASKVFAGGIAVSLMHQAFLDETKWRGVRFIKGLLKKSPSESMQLDDFEGELYADDHSKFPIEDHIPDYEILDQIDYTYPVADAYFAYASRGCTRKCSFCGVPKLEGGLYETPSLSTIVDGIKERHGEKKDLILMDNNVVASPKFHDIIKEIVDLGFTPGAKLKRDGKTYKRRVDFNQGVDARILCKDPGFLEEMAKIGIKPLRIAFDHVGLKKQYEQSVRYAAKVGLVDLSNYMLYNFHDTPADLYERMRINIDLNEELNTKIFSFPMRYQPTDRKDRGFVGAKWNRYQLRSMQIILQATHGVVSGAPKFFKHAFGGDASEFEELLLRPTHYTFHREWYEKMEGKEQYLDYRNQLEDLADGDIEELKEVLSDYWPSKFEQLKTRKLSKRVKEIFMHYRPLPAEESAEISKMQKQQKAELAFQNPNLNDEERVEDAGLDQDANLADRIMTLNANTIVDRIQTRAAG